MRILYVGPGAVGSNSTSMARGFAALGHDVLAVWTDAVSKPTRFGPAWTYKRATGRRAPWTIRTVTDALAQARDFRPDMLFCFKTVQLPQEELLAVNARVKVHYSPDDVSDPYFTSPAYLKSEHLWDLIVTTKDYCAPEIRAGGRRRCCASGPGTTRRGHFRQPRTVTPAARGGFHRERPLARPRSDRAPARAVGNLRPDDARGRRGLEAHLGAGQGDAAARRLRAGLRRDHRQDPVQHRHAQRAGRAHHPVRTRFRPVVVCSWGERTTEHSEMYDEDKEAFFFSSLSELTEKLTMISADHELARSVALRGWQRVTGTPNTYADRAREIVAAVEA